MEKYSKNLHHQNIFRLGQLFHSNKQLLFLIFTFVFVGTLAFLLSKNLSTSSAASTAGFKAGNIISDYVMGDYNSMSESDIQNFLKSKNRCNDTDIYGKGSISRGYVAAGSQYGVTYNYQMTFNKSTGGTATYHYHVEGGHFVCLADERFGGESAAHIIWQAAQDYHISPKVLIVLLEKEQALISDTWPNTDLAYRSATGYGCPDSAACSSEYYGFKNQIRNAANFFRKNLDGNPNWTNYPVGWNNILYSPFCSTRGAVYVENRATGALYTYTPYQPNQAALNAGYGLGDGCSAYGNRNFYLYYTDWFGDTHSEPKSIYIPDNDTFELKTTTNKYLAASSTNVVIKTSPSEAERRFKFVRTGNYYYIQNVATNQVIDIDTDGASLKLSAKSNACSQKWWISTIYNVGNNYAIRSACSTWAIDVPGGSTNDDTRLQVYPAHFNSNQQWILNTVSNASVANGYYVIETTGNKAIDIKDGNTANGTRSHTWNVTFGNNQQFFISRNADGTYGLKNVASGRMLEVSNSSSENGAAVQLWASNASVCAQKWIIVKNGGNYIFKNSCSNKALDVPMGYVSQTNQLMQIFDTNGTNAQNFYLRPLQTIADGNYTIVSNLNANMVLDISGGAETAKDGTNLQIWPSNQTNAQKFTVKYDANKRAYTISNTTAKRVIDVAGAGTSAGTNTQVWPSNYTCAQYWRLHQMNDGTYNLFSYCSDKALDVSGANTKAGTNVQIWDYNNTNAQKWKFTKI